MIPKKLKTNATIFKVLGWLAIIGSVLGSIVAITLVVMSGDSEALVGTLIVMIPVAIGGVIIGVLYFLIAKGIHNRKDWARIVGFILAILMLVSIPIGTILGIILLIGFSDEESKAWFYGVKVPEPQSPEPPPPPAE